MEKKDKYIKLIFEIRSVLEGERDIIANMANVSSMLHEAFGFWWTGFYRVLSAQENQELLVLGPFQGTLACTRIGYGKGVCGTCWKNKVTIIVPDVHKFPGHIACSSLSNSEIVVPLWKDNVIIGVLDIDSKEYSFFDEVDAECLEEVCRLIIQNSDL